MARSIFMFIDGDAGVSESPEKRAASMEAIDVEAGECDVVCDDSGLVCEPIVLGEKRVQLVPTESWARLKVLRIGLPFIYIAFRFGTIGWRLDCWSEVAL